MLQFLLSILANLAHAYYRAEMYAGRVVRCVLVSYGLTVSMPTGQTDSRTDAQPLHYALC